MPKPMSTRSSAKRGAILDAAQQVFLETGYAAASMDTVAALAGVSKATIYAHFKGKDDLFAAMMGRRCEQSYAFAPPPDETDARSALTEMARRLTALLLSAEALALYRVVVAEAARQPDLARAFYETGPATAKASIAEVLARLAARGELAVPDPWEGADQFIGLLRTDVYMRALLGLPAHPDRTIETTIAAAVETMMRAHRPAPARG